MLKKICAGAWLLLGLAVQGADPLPAQEILNAKRILFLGDSITYGGEYIEFIETYVRVKHPESKAEFLNLGLPSETLSGLSEPGHAGGTFPRPVLHERLGRLLEKTKPDLIVACYGLNDGIYYPFSEERFQKFQEGVLKLRQQANDIKAKVIHITPPSFDPVPIKGKTLPAGRVEYRSPYEGYNDVMGRYAQWLIKQRAEGWMVVDAHNPMNAFLELKRTKAPTFRLANDGVHINPQGHWLIAREFLRHLGASETLWDSEKHEALLEISPSAPEVLKLVQQRQRLLKDAWLNEVGHQRPGMAKGKPLAEALVEAKALDEQIHRLVAGEK